ncbi:hypothetical protein ACFOLC_00910 [Lysobacter cavernae]|uniref:Uncharacterized protein n=1 Tax=Lysobacter cavernae TaxID=1685901 RepID=A0ABV7RJ88_9GAMM
MHRSSMVQALPYLQARVGIDDVGIERLRRAITAKPVEAQGFVNLANGVVEHSPPEPLARLLTDVAGLPGGDVVALDILHMYFFVNKATAATAPEPLLKVGRQMLAKLNPAQASGHRAHGLAKVIKICCSGSGTATSIAVASALRSGLEAGDIHFYETREVINSLCEAQPHVVLDTFVLASPEDDVMWRWDIGGRKGLPYKSIGATAIQAWASVDPEARYALLGPAMSLFSRGDFEESAQLDPLFADLLRLAPDKTAFLGRFDHQVHSNQWSGSLKAMLESRRAELVRLAKEMSGEVADWVNQGLPDLNRWIDSAGDMDRDQEESFE